VLAPSASLSHSLGRVEMRDPAHSLAMPIATADTLTPVV
jgi:hypothetical protein